MNLENKIFCSQLIVTDRIYIKPIKSIKELIFWSLSQFYLAIWRLFILIVNRSLGLICYVCNGCSDSSKENKITCSPGNSNFCKVPTYSSKYIFIPFHFLYWNYLILYKYKNNKVIHWLTLFIGEYFKYFFINLFQYRKLKWYRKLL